MLTANYVKKLSTTLLVILSLVTSTIHAAVDLNTAGKYQYKGQITAVEQVSRLLTIETSTLATKGLKNYLSVESKTYKLAVGAKLNNLPKKLRYSGLKNLNAGNLVSFNVKPGTEKQEHPTITEMWIEVQ